MSDALRTPVRRMYDGGAVRHEPRDSLDDFPTPPWATRALCQHVLGDCSALSVLEPACGRSRMARPLGEYFGTVHQSDIAAYEGADACALQLDFLCDDYSHPSCPEPDWIITNPPFRHAEGVVSLALHRASIGVAIFVRGQFLHAVGRYRRLFAENPPHILAPFAERVPIVRGRIDPKASTTMDYSWFVWRLDQPATQPRLMFIPPCRESLERAEDYWAAGFDAQASSLAPS